ncbi:MAG: AmmeMemoRadiSam system protein B [Desulfobulbaceae bacterium]
MRSPVVADRFYPGSETELRAALGYMVPECPDEEKIQALGVMSPHAGYVYSGGVAGETLSRVRIPETVLIMGPNHHGRGAALALGMEDWQMPLGEVTVDRKLAGLILDRSAVITHDETAHAYEHSLEVQVPFLQYLRPDMKIVPIVVSHLSYPVCEEAAADLAAAIREYGRQVLVLASTDMTHYESRASAGRKDRLALERVEALDPRGLYDTVLGTGITMCGIMPTTIMLLAALRLGASKAELVRYTDSGEASGDTSQVVGYAGVIVH